MVVQVGEVLDRGDDEIAILSLLSFLDQEARVQGGAVYMVRQGVSCHIISSALEALADSFKWMYPSCQHHTRTLLSCHHSRSIVSG